LIPFYLLRIDMTASQSEQRNASPPSLPEVGGRFIPFSRYLEIACVEQTERTPADIILSRVPKGLEVEEGCFRGKIRKSIKDYCATRSATNEHEAQGPLGDCLQFSAQKIKSCLPGLSNSSEWSSEDVDYILKLVEDVAWTFLKMSKADGPQQFAFAVVDFMKFRTKRAALSELKEIFEGLISFAGDASVALGGTSTSTGHEAQGNFGDFLKLARGLTDNFEGVLKSPMYEKLYNFMSYCLATSLFDGIGIFDYGVFKQMRKQAIKEKKHAGLSFIHTVFDTLLFLCERGYQAFQMKSLEPLYHSDSAYDEWYTECAWLQDNHQFISCSRGLGWEKSTYMGKLLAAIEKGVAIVKLLKAKKCTEHKFAELTLRKLEMIKSTEFSRSFAASSRNPPFAVLVYGQSSIGKSGFIQLLFYRFGKSFNLSIESEFKFTISPAEEFYNNFQTPMWCIVTDDAGCYSTEISKQGGDKTIINLLQLQNSTAFSAPQADLADKGKTPVRPELIIGTTNTEHLNLRAYFSCPFAVARRFPMVLDLRVKEQFADEHGMLDPAKVPELEDGTYPNFWHIVVKKAIPVVRDGGVDKRANMDFQYEIVADFLEIEDFLAYYSETCYKYRCNQDKAARADKAMKAVEVCRVDESKKKFVACWKRLDKCTCNQNEAQGHKRPGVTTGSESKRPCGSVTVCPVCTFDRAWCMCTFDDYFGNMCAICGLENVECVCFDLHCHICERLAIDCGCRPCSCCGRPPVGCECPPCGLCDRSDHICNRRCTICTDMLFRLSNATDATDDDECGCCNEPLQFCECVRGTCHVCGDSGSWSSHSSQNGQHAQQDGDVAVLGESLFQDPPDPATYNIEEELNNEEMRRMVERWRQRVMGQQTTPQITTWRQFFRWCAVGFWEWALWFGVVVRLLAWVSKYSFGAFIVLYIYNITTPYPGPLQVTLQNLLQAAVIRSGSRVQAMIAKHARFLRFAKFIVQYGLAALSLYTVYQTVKTICSIGKQPTKEEVLDNSKWDDEVADNEEEAQGNVVSTTIEKYPALVTADDRAPGTDKVNPYHTTEVAISAMDYTKKSGSWAAFDDETLSRHIAYNCATLIVRYPETKTCKPIPCFCVGGQLWMTTNHSLFSGTKEYEFFSAPRRDGITENTKIILAEEYILRDPLRDLAFFVIRDIPCKPFVKDLFTEGLSAGKHDGMLITRQQLGGIKVRQVFAAQYLPNYRNTELHTRRVSIANTWRGLVAEPTNVGDCGSVLVLRIKKAPVIAGIHYLGDGKRLAFTIAVCQKDIDRAAAHLGGLEASPGVLKISAPSAKKEIVPIHEKSEVCYVAQGSAIIFGGVTGIRPSSKSEVFRTVLCEPLVRRGWPIRHGAPKLRGWLPARNVLLDMMDPVSKFDPAVIDASVDGFANDVICGLSKLADPYKHLGFLSLSDAINGVPGVKYLDSMKRQTSAGFPWQCSKKNFWYANPTAKHPDGIMFSDEVLERVNDCLECYARGERYNPVYNLNLKDEVRSLEKCQKGLTRGFTGAPVEHVIAMRIMFLPLIKLAMDNQYLFECAAGIVATSKEWHKLHKHMTRHGENRCFDGDYKAYDKKFSAKLMCSLFHRFLLVIARKSGKYSARELKQMETSAFDIAFPVVHFFQVLMMLYGTDPSGQIMTTIINCFGNSTYMRSAFLEMHPLFKRGHNGSEYDNWMKILATFQDLVTLITYGDDNYLNVSSKVSHFNHTTVSTYLSARGIEYTSADKVSDSIPFKHATECSFLKRGFSFIPEMEWCCPQLEEKSLQKMLMFGVRSHAISESVQVIQKIGCAMREYFFYGREVFEARAQLLREIVDEVGLTDIIEPGTFRTFDSFLSDFCSDDSDAFHNGVPRFEELEGEFEAQGNPGVSEHVQFETKNSPAMVVTVSPSWNLIGSEEWTIVVDPGERSSKSLLRDVLPSPHGSKPGLANECRLPLYYPLGNQLPITRLCGRRKRTKTVDVIVTAEPMEDYFVQRNAITEYSEFSQQSGVVIDDHEAKQASQRQELVEYLDENKGDETGFAADPTAFTAPDLVTTALLANFLRRPVKINTLLWDSATAAPTDIVQQLLPWDLYFNTTAVKDKIKNFAFLKCNLKIKIVLNATPFLYGAGYVSYLPMDGIYQENINDTSLTPWPSAMCRTQRPHMYIYPQNSEGGEMTLPFFYYKDWLSVGLRSDFQTMGKLTYSWLTALKSANGVPAIVSLQTYAWAEDVELSGPTSAFAMQAGVVKDEYGQGVVSKPASAIAGVAAKLKSVPYIGPFATATEIGARAIGSIASLFGFSNPPVISNVQPLNPRPFAHLASPEICFPFEKLTLDPKNELTVDPTIVGLPRTDELDISSIVTRECFLHLFNWSKDDAPDTLKFTARVNPNMYHVTTTGPTTEVQMSPMTLVNHMFEFWRGDIIFRFRVIASQYHKGRLRISWDPYGGITQVDPDTTHLVQTAIIDIGKDSDVEFRVPYHQALPWLRSNMTLNLANQNWKLGTTPGLTVDQAFHNGILTVRTLTDLTAPSTSAAGSSIDILIFIRGAENLEFAGPRTVSGPDAQTNYSMWPAQAGVVDDLSHRTTEIVAGTTYTPKPQRFLENMGERVTNLRVLLRRSTLHSHWMTESTATNPYLVMSSILSAFPYYYGYANTLKSGSGTKLGVDTASPMVAGSGIPFNWSYDSYLNWIAPAFIGWRGSINWTQNVNAHKAVTSVRIGRDPFYLNDAFQVLNTTWNQNKNQPKMAWNASFGGMAGLALTNQLTNAGISVSVPYYSPFKFTPCNPYRANRWSQSDGSVVPWNTTIDLKGSAVDNVLPGLKIDRYVAAGADFNLLFFINAPTRFLFATPPDIP
jgi:hypothetical protein